MVFDEGKFYVKKEILTNAGHFWHFDEYGNKVITPSEDELPLDYQKEGNLYIRIKDYNLDQDNIEECIIYLFEIYMYGKETYIFIPNLLASTLEINLNGYKEEHFQEISNNIAYTDIFDCLSDALQLIKLFKPEVIDWFKYHLDKNYISEAVSISSLES